MDSLLDEPRRVAVELGIRLDRQATLETVLPLEDGQQQLGCLHRHLLDEPPGDLVLGGRRALGDELLETALPERPLLLQHLADDGGVGRRADGAVLDRIRQLLDRARVVPVVGGRRRNRFMQRALDLGVNRHQGSFLAVVARTTRRGSSRIRRGGPSKSAAIRSSSRRMPAAASSSCGCATVVKPIRASAPTAMPSKPTIETSAGTRRPASSRRSTRSIARMSFAAATAVASSTVVSTQAVSRHARTKLSYRTAFVRSSTSGPVTYAMRS